MILISLNIKNGGNKRVVKKKAVSKEVEFKLSAPDAKNVSVAGDFNNWNPAALPAKKDSKGTWKAKISLSAGSYQYKFVVDGNWQNDPKCKACVANSFGSQNCLINVK